MGRLMAASGIYLILYTVFIGVGLLVRIRVNSAYRVLAVLAAGAVGVFGYCLQPDNSLDLFRLHEHILTLTYTGKGFLQRIWNAQSTRSGESSRGMIAWNLICYLVQQTRNVSWLSAGCSFVTVCILGYMLTDYTIAKGYSSRALAVGFCLCFMGMQIQYILSGIRNSLAVAISFLALYLAGYKKGNLVVALLLYLLAVTIHQMALIFIVPVGLSWMKRQWLFRGIALFTLPLVFALASLVSNVSFPLVSSTASRILYYTTMEYAHDRPEMIADVAVFAVVALAYWRLLRMGVIRQEGTLEKLYANAYYLMGFMMMGCVFQRDFVLRIGYIMGIAAAPLVLKMLFRSEKKGASALLWLGGMSVGIFACCVKVFYDSWYVISQWTFG